MGDAGLTHRDRWAVGGMLALNTMILTLWLSGQVTGLVMVTLNAVVALLVFTLNRKSDLRMVLAGLTMVLGPLGGIVLVCLLVRPMRWAGAPSVAAAGEDLPPMSRAEAICAALVDGRRFSPREAAPPSFAGLFVGDDLTAQQRALMIMARAFDPDLRPALQAALASPLPAVRVQAAAVFAYLRDTYARQARDVLTGHHGLEGAALLAQIDRLQLSGFLDAQTGSLLAAVIPAKIKSGDVGTATTRPTRNGLAAPPPIKRYSCGGIA